MAPSTESTPWVERYRPKTLKDVSHQTEVVATLQNATATGRLPHLLLYGPPGSGKVRNLMCWFPRGSYRQAASITILTLTLACSLVSQQRRLL